MISEQGETSNPYRSPVAVIEMPSGGPPSMAFRWRIIPTFATILCGVPSLLAAVVESGLFVWTVGLGEAPGHWRDPPAGWLAADAALCLVAGVWFMMASRAWWNARYKRAIVLTVLASGLYVASALIKANVIFSPCSQAPAWEHPSSKLCFAADRVSRRSRASRKCGPKQSLGPRGSEGTRNSSLQSAICNLQFSICNLLFREGSSPFAPS